MPYRQGLAGIGSGMMQGLELSRRHRFQDEEQQRAQRNEQRQDELFGLKTDQMRSNMQFNDEYRPIQLQQARSNAEFTEQYNPLRLQQAEGNLAHQNEMRPLQMEQARVGLDSARFQNDRSQQQAALQDWQSSGRVALMAAQQGDLGAINSWLSNSPGQERAMFTEGEDGGLNLMLDMGGDGELLERPVSMEELPMIIRTMAGMEQPAPVKGMNINSQLVNPQTGELMGDFRDADKRGGAGGQGSGMSGVDRQRYFDQARKSINDVLRTHVGEQFMGDPEARDIQALAQGATYQVLDDLIRSGRIEGASPEVLGNTAISLAFSGDYPGLRISEAEGMARDELSQGNRRWQRGPSEDEISALARQIQQEASQAYHADIASMVMGEQQPPIGGQQQPPQQQGMPPRGGQQQPGQPPIDQQTGLPITISQPQEQSQQQGMPGPQQPPQAVDLQDYMQGGFIRDDQINDSVGAMFGRQVRDKVGGQIDRLGRFGSQTTVGLALQGMPEVRDNLGKVNQAFRHNVAGQIDGVMSLGDIFNPGISSRDVPPAAQNIMQAIEAGQRPAPADIQDMVQFAERYPDALTDQGLVILMQLAEEEGL